MMIMITNRCRMGCPHCMQDSSPDGGLMEEETFVNALKFAKDAGANMLTISGGEPTEHPKLLDFCKMASKNDFMFSVCTNGMWLGDEKAEWRFEKVAKLRGFAGAQVYSNPKWYRLHNETIAKYKAQEARWQNLKVLLDTSEIQAMMDLGRARTCEAAMEEVRASKFHNSCLQAHVTAMQVPGNAFFKAMMMQKRFCTPMVDWQGNFHASECWFCQSFGNVNTDRFYELIDKLRKGRPCGKCIPCQRYLSEDEQKMVQARALLGQYKKVSYEDVKKLYPKEVRKNREAK